MRVIFQLMDLGRGPGSGGIGRRRAAVPSRYVRFDLELLLRPKGEGLHGEIAYSTDLFDGATIERSPAIPRPSRRRRRRSHRRRVHELPLLTETRAASDRRSTGTRRRSHLSPRPVHSPAFRGVGRAVAVSGGGGLRQSDRSRMGGSMRGPTSWRVICGRWESRRGPMWACASAARPR